MEDMEQEQALEQMQKEYGAASFTEDHQHYRRVGYRPTKKTVVSAIGETWTDAMARLKERING